MFCRFALSNNNLKQNIMKTKYYLRTPLHGNEFKICNEITDEVIAIFFNQNDASIYLTFLNK
jgi:hypothetical protein